MPEAHASEVVAHREQIVQRARSVVLAVAAAAARGAGLRVRDVGVLMVSDRSTTHVTINCSNTALEGPGLALAQKGAMSSPSMGKSTKVSILPRPPEPSNLKRFRVRINTCTRH